MTDAVILILVWIKDKLGVVSDSICEVGNAQGVMLYL